MGGYVGFRGGSSGGQLSAECLSATVKGVVQFVILTVHAAEQIGFHPSLEHPAGRV